MNEKSILEQALLQVQNLEEAVKANAKGILASTMKEELNELLRESMEEGDEEVTETELPNSKEEDEKDMSEEAETSEQEDDEDETSDDNEDDSLDNEEPSTDDVDSLDTDDEFSSDEDEVDGEDDVESDMDTPSFDEPSFGDDETEDSEDVLDMTNSTDDEVLKVFKAMKPEDGIVVKKDGNKVELETGEDEFIIKLDEPSETEETPDMSGEDSFEDEVFENDEPFEKEVSEEEETVYEIELDDEGDDTKEVEATESARTIGNGYHAGIKSKNVYKAGNKRDEINEEVQKLKKQNQEYKKALVLFKDKLNEVAVFNASLAYATRLFTEHSTTKQEKLNIIKRFDTVSTMNESKNLYNQIKTELDTKKPVTETVVEKISLTPSTSSSEILSESKAYENPQFKRMKDLMSKIK
jgi:hypothetical protein